jgi:sRNA-binding regulator protein Hfq
MEKDKKKENPVKSSVDSKIIISTLKKSLVEEPKKNPEADQLTEPVGKKKSTSSFTRNDAQNTQVAEFTGKEKQRHWDWVRFKTQIKIKLINGDIYQGYLRWYDRYAVKLITATEEIVIPKHSILCYFDAPKARREEVTSEAVAPEKTT